jgi:glutamate synthase domain-containing protein 3
MSDIDYDVVKEQLRDHFRYTGSMAALEILNDWEISKNRFSKIMPVEYKAILERKSVVKVQPIQNPFLKMEGLSEADSRSL